MAGAQGRSLAGVHACAVWCTAFSLLRAVALVVQAGAGRCGAGCWKISELAKDFSVHIGFSFVWQ